LRLPRWTTKAGCSASMASSSARTGATSSARSGTLPITVKVKAKAGEEGKLYGSVTSRDIAQQLDAQGVEVDRRKIIIDEAIRSLGEFRIPVKLHPEVVATIKVVVGGEEKEQDEPV